MQQRGVEKFLALQIVSADEGRYFYFVGGWGSEETHTHSRPKEKDALQGIGWIGKPKLHSLLQGWDSEEFLPLIQGWPVCCFEERWDGRLIGPQLFYKHSDPALIILSQFISRGLWPGEKPHKVIVLSNKELR